MPKIIIDGKQIECRPGIPVLQAALEAGWDVPHYCYHPGLTVVASCRLCLMEMKMPHPKTKEMAWAPKLFPSCQTPVKDGMEVRFASEAVKSNQQHCMEYYLLNHPLDCPVCDKAGECSLQDYSERFGTATSRMVEDKHKNPKKDIGPKTLLYMDRCVLCTRCVRFCDEIAGTGELAVVERGSRSEIDVFPGVPLENDLQGNVVDLCPVGCLLDKKFLFRQRVWTLTSTPSISPADSTGQAIWVDHNERGVHRVRPRFNDKVNDWWISDEARHTFDYVNRDDRLSVPQMRGDNGPAQVRWEQVAQTLRDRLGGEAGGSPGAVAFVLSPMLSCEEAWLLASFARQVAPDAALVLGHVPTVGKDKTFPKGFRITAEKCPNRRGVSRIIEHLGGQRLDFEQFVASAGQGDFRAAYVYAGYPNAWVSQAAADAIGRIPFLVVHDLFHSPLDPHANVLLPAAAWTEREGTFMNVDGLIQPFERARPPRPGVKAEGQFFLELLNALPEPQPQAPAGGTAVAARAPARALVGLYRSAKIRALMAEQMPEFKEVFVPRKEPAYAH